MVFKSYQSSIPVSCMVHILVARRPPPGGRKKELIHYLNNYFFKQSNCTNVVKELPVLYSYIHTHTYILFIKSELRLLLSRSHWDTVRVLNDRLSEPIRPSVNPTPPRDGVKENHTRWLPPNRPIPGGGANPPPRSFCGIHKSIPPPPYVNPQDPPHPRDAANVGESHKVTHRNTTRLKEFQLRLGWGDHPPTPPEGVTSRYCSAGNHFYI